MMEGNRVVWEYDLEGTANQPTHVVLSVTVDGKTYAGKDLHLEGDVGKVTTGKGKKLWWNVLQDFPRGLSSKIDWELTIKGGYADPVTGMQFVFVKGGCFQTGDTSLYDRQEVCVDDFYMGKYEVTQGEWEKVMRNNPSYIKKGPSYPVENVMWVEVQDFIGKLNAGTRKQWYRLPTEAEWEYAARSGGKKEKWAGTSSDSDLGRVAWYDGNSYSSTHPVGSKDANGLGLHDMSGNVWEWCTNRLGKTWETTPVVRGGSWLNGPVGLHIENWYKPDMNLRVIHYGFRLVRSAQD